jgi:hypothetical protein
VSWDTWRTNSICIGDEISEANVTTTKKSRHHFDKFEPESNPSSKARTGWSRSMYYSLTQQIIRQDLGYYCINAALRPDNAWRLISYPYYTKDTQPGENTGFLHLDIGISELLRSGCGQNLIQSAISLDDEDTENCTVILPGMHRDQKLAELWSLHTQASKGPDGKTTNMSKVFTSEIVARCGRPQPIPCCCGDVRISMPHLPHGSTNKASIRRRVLFPWLIKIEDNHSSLEMPHTESWQQLAACHRDCTAPFRTSSGLPVMYGRPSSTFPAFATITSPSPVNAALIGGKRWDDATVIGERDVLLGADHAKALELIQANRSALLAAFRKAFKEMRIREASLYRERSYFAQAGKTGLAPEGEGER